MHAHICSVGIFPDTKTIFVSPVMTVRMYQFHQELYESLKNLIQRAGNGIVQTLGRRIALVKLTFPVEELFTVKLKKQ